LNQDHQLASLITVIRQVIVANIAIFQSLLAFLTVSSSKSNKWSLVTKLVHKGMIACEDNSQNELQCVESSLSNLLSEGINDRKMQTAHQSLEALENAIESIENGLESVFRRIVKTRACLLNIMTR
jgi:hypothetical protein